MPLEIKEIEWSETENNVTLKVPLKGANTKTLDIFSSPKYIKVSAPPYYYEVALHDEIDDDISKATINNGQVLFHLQKVTAGLWGQLHASLHKDKEYMKELRAQSLEQKQAKEQEKEKERAAMREQQKKYAVREQMRVDNEERKMREEQKRKEMEQISRDMEQWKNNETGSETKPSEEKKAPNETERTHVDDEKLIEKKNEKNKQPTPKSSPRINTQMPLPGTTVNASSKDGKDIKSLPAPRQSGSIQVDFTPRKLATPARESKLPEEELWLKKVSEMNKMRKVENAEDVVDMEEMNPVWLKDKGNGFFQQGNFVAAINAYTSALVLDSSIPMLYANRAACHLSLKQHRECIQDCTNALELYDPPVQDNAMSRCRALTRRGTAYYQLHQYVDALRDYDAAIKLDPKNQALRTDAFKIRRTLQGGESSD
eukprot:TCONS_00072791-protein